MIEQNQGKYLDLVLDTYNEKPTSSNAKAVEALMKDSILWIALDSFGSMPNVIEGVPINKVIEMIDLYGNELGNIKVGNKNFLPIFTRAAEALVLGESLTAMPLSCQDIMKLAHHYEKELNGIIVNPHKHAYIISKNNCHKFETLN